jgi:hypothetical protein
MFIKISRLFLGLIFLVIPFFAFGQPRHSKGQNMIGCSFGLGEKSQIYGLSYQYFLDDTKSIKTSVLFDKTSFVLTKYQSFALKPELYYTVLTNNKNRFLNLKAGAFVGSEYWENEIFKKTSKTFFGVDIGSSLEIYVFPRLKLEVEIEQQFLSKSLLAQHRFIAQLGTMFTF